MIADEFKIKECLVRKQYDRNDCSALNARKKVEKFSALNDHCECVVQSEKWIANDVSTNTIVEQRHARKKRAKERLLYLLRE